MDGVGKDASRVHEADPLPAAGGAGGGRLGGGGMFMAGDVPPGTFTGEGVIGVCSGFAEDGASLYVGETGNQSKSAKSLIVAEGVPAGVTGNSGLAVCVSVLVVFSEEARVPLTKGSLSTTFGSGSVWFLGTLTLLQRDSKYVTKHWSMMALLRWTDSGVRSMRRLGLGWPVEGAQSTNDLRAAPA